MTSVTTGLIPNSSVYASGKMPDKKSETKAQTKSQIANTALPIIGSKEFGQISLQSLYGKVASNIESTFPNIPKTLTSLISSYVIPCFDIVDNNFIHKNYKKIAEDLKEIRRQGIKPDRQTYINLLHVVIDEKLEESAWVIFNLAIEDDIYLKRESYLDLLNLFVEKWHEKKICIVFEKMTDIGLMPNTKISNTLMTLFAKRKNKENTLKLFQVLKDKDIKFSRLTYNYLLDLFIKTKNTNAMIKIFMEMIKNNVKIDKVNSIILSEQYQMDAAQLLNSSPKKILLQHKKIEDRIKNPLPSKLRIGQFASFLNNQS